MNFIVSSSALLKQLQHIVGVIGSNIVLPILEDFLFEIEGKKLTVVATDLETVMKVEVDVEANEKGKVCIPAKILIDALKNTPNQPLTITIESNYEISITSDNGKYKLMGENPANFPKEPVPDGQPLLNIPAKVLVTAITKTVFATGTDDLRPAMTGVLFELTEGEGVKFVATDAHRLVKYARKDLGINDTRNFIVPRKPLNLLKSALPANEENVEISVSENHLFINHPALTMSCRLIDARFPDYRVVIPTETPYEMVVDRVDFQNALRRVSIFSNKSTNQVVLNLAGSELHLTSQDIDYSSEGNERMKCEYNGDDMVIAFNARLLIEMLSVSEGDQIKMLLSTPNRAGLIKPVEETEDEDLLMLVMPLMVNQ